MGESGPESCQDGGESYVGACAGDDDVRYDAQLYMWRTPRSINRL